VQTEGAVTELPDEDKPIYDAFDIEDNDRQEIERYLYMKYKSYAELQLKYHTVMVYDLFLTLPEGKINDVIEKSEYGGGYYADISNMYGNLAGSVLSYSSEQGVYERKTSELGDSPCWELIYEYIDDPYKVFSTDVEIKDIYCITFGRTDFANTHIKDLAVYYETDKGRFILYRPFEYEAKNAELPIYDLEDCIIRKGYSDMVYLFPVEIMSSGRSYVNERMNLGLEYPTYYGEFQLHRIIDLEPYKFVPGQLPQ
jgi:hypothetical protein